MGHKVLPKRQHHTDILEWLTWEKVKLFKLPGDFQATENCITGLTNLMDKAVVEERVGDKGLDPTNLSLVKEEVPFEKVLFGTIWTKILQNTDFNKEGN